jgi:hypothetical protein
MEQTKSIDQCICPHCNAVFYLGYPNSKTKIVTCYACKKDIRVELSIEFTCTAIEKQETKIVETKHNEPDLIRQSYLAGYRDAYANFRRPIY